MRKNKFVGALFISLLCLIMHQSTRNTVNGNSFGVQVINGRGYTNSPSDNRACNVTGCHNGSLNTGPGTVEITSTIPPDGYKAGVRYSVTAKITQSGRTKFGFQLTAEDNSNQKVGRFLAGAETRAPSDFFVTHGTSAASSTGSGTKSWTFNWDAPNQSGSGVITFYAAFNGANNNGSSSGDNIYSTSLIVSENILSNVQETNNSTLIQLFPNPTENEVHLQLIGAEVNGPISYSVYDNQGKVVLNGIINQKNEGYEKIVELSNILPGVYQVLFSGKDFHHTSKLIKR